MLHAGVSRTKVAVNSVVISFNMFMNDPAINKLIVKPRNDITSIKLEITKSSILTSQDIANKEATIISGNLLVDNGYVQKEYVDSCSRERKKVMQHILGMGWPFHMEWKAEKNMLTPQISIDSCQMVLSGTASNHTY